MTVRPGNRSGITLLEVIIALAIFVGAVVVLSQLIGHGTDAIERARLETEAALVAETIMNEMDAGIIPAASGSGTRMEQPEWNWQASIAGGPVSGLRKMRLEVFTRENRQRGRSATNFRFIVERWMFAGARLSSIANKMDGPLAGNEK